MKRAIIIFNIMIAIAVLMIFSMCYFAAVHPLLTILSGFIGINALVFTMLRHG